MGDSFSAYLDNLLIELIRFYGLHPMLLAHCGTLHGSPNNSSKRHESLANLLSQTLC